MVDMNNGMFGKTHTQKSKDKISKSLKGIQRTAVTRQKIREATLGNIPGNKILVSKELIYKIAALINTTFDSTQTSFTRTLENMLGFSCTPIQRITGKSISQIIEYLNIYIPRKHGGLIGLNEKAILDDLEELIGIKIYRQYSVARKKIDGYIPKLNLAIEIDEPHHFIGGKLSSADITRQKYIEDRLGCEFLRIREKEWLQNEWQQSIKTSVES